MSHTVYMNVPLSVFMVKCMVSRVQDMYTAIIFYGYMFVGCSFANSPIKWAATCRLEN